MNTKTTTTTGRTANLKRLRLSANGNPRFTVTLDDGRVLQTSSDAGIAYAIENPEYSGDSRELRAGALAPLLVFTLTRAGRISNAEVSK